MSVRSHRIGSAVYLLLAAGAIVWSFFTPDKLELGAAALTFVLFATLHECTASVIAAMSGTRRRSSARFTSGYLEGYSAGRRDGLDGRPNAANGRSPQ